MFTGALGQNAHVLGADRAALQMQAKCDAIVMLDLQVTQVDVEDIWWDIFYFEILVVILELLLLNVKFYMVLTMLAWGCAYWHCSFSLIDWLSSGETEWL